MVKIILLLLIHSMPNMFKIKPHVNIYIYPLLRIVKFLSALSFGVYLMHNLLIDALARITAIIPAYSIRCTILVYLVVLLISFLSIVVFSSIKFTSFVFTGVSYKSACKSCNLQFIISTLKREN